MKMSNAVEQKSTDNSLHEKSPFVRNKCQTTVRNAMEISRLTSVLGGNKYDLIEMKMH